MDYYSFKNSISDNYGSFYDEQFEIYFDRAIQSAEKGEIDSAIQIAKDALFISKFTSIGYDKIYLIGLLIRLFIDNNQPEYANLFFNFGMKIINANYLLSSDNELVDDINSFLDLRIEIENKLNFIS